MCDDCLINRPFDALAFKTSRLPVLWLGTTRWPDSKLTLISSWSGAAYLILAIFVALQIRRRQVIPESLYLYLLLILCASPLIHFEYRYTYPVWNMLVLAPGLLAAALAGKPAQSLNPEPTATASAARHRRRWFRVKQTAE